MRAGLILPVLTLSLAGCASWPDEGRGGFAERRTVESPELQRLTDRFAHQRARGADRMAAGLVDEARTLFVRAQRNHVAGFEDDHADDLRTLSGLIDRIEPHLAHR